MKELHVIIHGKVQGVWFRAWACDTARELNIMGWVRNMEDGKVEGVAQGDDDQLRVFLERLYDGPPLARVTRIDSAWRNVKTPFTSFEVRT